jgi:hypothetical protein
MHQYFLNAPGMGVIENTHSTDIESPPHHPASVSHISIHAEGKWKENLFRFECLSSMTLLPVHQDWKVLAAAARAPEDKELNFDKVSRCTFSLRVESAWFQHL